MMITIIVPVYNSKQYLHRCITSILEQTYSDIELILIDDGSTDGSTEICELFSLQDRRVRYIFQENRGVSNARNHGIEIMKGDYLLFVDSDDWLESNACELLIKLMDEGNYDMIVFNMIKHCNDKNKQKLCCTKRVQEKKKNEILRDIIVSDTKSGGGFIANKFFRVRAVKELPRFLETIQAYEDKVWELEYLQKLEKFLLTTYELYHYTIHEKSLSHDMKKIQRRLIDTVNAYEYILNIFGDSKLMPLARAQVNKKKMQAVYTLLHMKSSIEVIDEYIKELRGKYRYIYTSSYIGIGSKAKALYVQFIIDKCKMR